MLGKSNSGAGCATGDFWETELFIYFMPLFRNFSKSQRSNELRLIFPETPFNFASNGVGLMSGYIL